MNGTEQFLQVVIVVVEVKQACKAAWKFEVF